MGSRGGRPRFFLALALASAKLKKTVTLRKNEREKSGSAERDRKGENFPTFAAPHQIPGSRTFSCSAGEIARVLSKVRFVKFEYQHKAAGTDG